ncbi:MAG: response regulator [Ferruginibacter sp.]
MAIQPKHILIADDDQDDILLFENALEETCPDLKLTSANNGQTLLNLLKKISTPDAILLDLNMPKKNGKECLVEIRSNKEFNHVPIIILTTSANEADKAYCLSRGANQYYVKPSSFQGLKSIVQSICNGWY